MVEKKSGVQIAFQIDDETSGAFTDLEVFSCFLSRPVLLAAALALAHFQHDVCGRNLQLLRHHLAQCLIGLASSLS